jgi:hypothetical protein
MGLQPFRFKGLGDVHKFFNEQEWPDFCRTEACETGDELLLFRHADRYGRLKNDSRKGDSRASFLGKDD